MEASYTIGLTKKYDDCSIIRELTTKWPHILFRFVFNEPKCYVNTTVDDENPYIPEIARAVFKEPV